MNFPWDVAITAGLCALSWSLAQAVESEKAKEIWSMMGFVFFLSWLVAIALNLIG